MTGLTFKFCLGILGNKKLVGTNALEHSKKRKRTKKGKVVFMVLLKMEYFKNIQKYLLFKLNSLL